MLQEILKQHDFFRFLCRFLFSYNQKKNSEKMRRRKIVPFVAYLFVEF